MDIKFWYLQNVCMLSIQERFDMKNESVSIITQQASGLHKFITLYQYKIQSN